MPNTEQRNLDSYSLAILSELMRDSRQPLTQIAQSVGLSTTPCWKRIKEMEASGVIRGYSATIDAAKVGLGLRVLAHVNLAHHDAATVSQFEKTVAASRAIVDCYSTTGEFDYVLTVLAPDIKHYDQFLHDSLFKLPGITHVRSVIVLKEIKTQMH